LFSRVSSGKQRFPDYNTTIEERRMKRSIWIAVLALAALSILPAQQVKEMRFNNQAITDILLALAEGSGRSIIPDETVGGNASYYFAETDFETALKIFLTTYKMYYWKDGNIYYISRVRAQWSKELGTATLDAEEVEIRLIVRALSKAIGKTILFDSLPRENLSVHVENTKPDKILEMLVKRFPEYKVESNADYYYIRRIDATAAKTDAAGAKSTSLVGVQNSLYSIDSDKARLRDILIELFQKAGIEYSLFLRSDAILENLHFKSKPFEDFLRLILEQANADYTVEGNIYYIYDIQRADVMKKLKTIRTVPLTYISVQDLPNLFPQDMAAQNLFRMDRNTNSIILSGSMEEIGPIEEFIKSVDRPLEQKTYYRFDLSYLKVSEFLSLLPPQFSGLKPIALPLSNSFVLLLSSENKKALDEFLQKVDRKQAGVPIHLRYIQADSLLKNLPPSVVKEDIQQTGDSTLVFFTGSEDKQRQFMRELDMLDRPTPQIRYELLVIEYQNGEELNWSVTAAATKPDTMPTDSSFLGTIGQLLKLNFNIVSTFGYVFAVDLNLKLNTNKASVLADTTVNGLSGQEIKFQNTNTSRYRDLERDPDTGELKPTGVTREITSGLIISMNGWVSGDGMITMKVASTISKQGADTSSSSGSLPPTSEKIVSTNVRTASGQPVVISGLIQQEKQWIIDKTPILGDIPLLGLLFQSRREVLMNTELVIYIVPHVEYPELRQADAGLRMERLYQSLVRE
jgi:general secretion pathway protein D